MVLVLQDATTETIFVTATWPRAKDLNVVMNRELSNRLGNVVFNERRSDCTEAYELKQIETQE